MSTIDLLLDHHRALLEASAIADAVMRERGYRSITDPNDLAIYGFAEYQRRTPCLLLPLHSPAGNRSLTQIRPEVPRSDLKRPGKCIKYETPAGSQMRLDVPPRSRPHLSYPKVELWITEGILTCPQKLCRSS